MKIKHTKSASTLMTLCFVASPLVSGAMTTIIGNGINGGELDRKFVDPLQTFPNEAKDVHWDGGIRPDNGFEDFVEFRLFNNLTPTVGVHWMDSSASQRSQVITNKTLFDVAADTTMTLSIDFSRWAFGSSTQNGTVVTFSMGSTILGTITYAMDTNGTGAWNTYTVTDVPVAAGTNQAFVINTNSDAVPVANRVSWGFALDNLTLTSTVVPEPSTALMGVVALGFAIGRRRRA